MHLRVRSQEGMLHGFHFRPLEVRTTFHREILGAGAQEVDDVHMATDVDQDLQLRAQCLQLGAVGERLHHLDGDRGVRFPRPEVGGRGAIHVPKCARAQEVV